MALTVARSLIRFGTLAVLALLAYELIELQFRLGARNGIRGLTALAAFLLAGGYAFVVHRSALQRIGAWPAAARFAAAFAAGALTLASLRYLLSFYPIPLSELAIASSIAVVGFGSGPLAPSGIAAGMLAYVALFGVPGIVRG